ncbi:unnamed protein product [Rhizophagus irregularis]|nr:unnamed protein product [Rhizophagus irregularis]
MNDLNGLDFERDAFLNLVFGLDYEEERLPGLRNTSLDFDFGLGYKEGRLPRLGSQAWVIKGNTFLDLDFSLDYIRHARNYVI